MFSGFPKDLARSKGLGAMTVRPDLIALPGGAAIRAARLRQS